MVSPILPAALRAAAELEIDKARTALRDGMSRLSETYRDGGRSTESMDFAAYLAARLPATYAAVSKAVGAAVDHIEGLAPRRMVDVGSGPGTASWVCAEVFTSLEVVTFLDSNKPFLDLAERLAKASGQPALHAAKPILGDLLEVPVQSDLVVAAYALAESPEARAAQIAQHLWSRTDQALILVEPGTPAGFARLRLARLALIAEGAKIAAPCPHMGACPMTDGDWCHFSVRLPRSRAHMQAKGASVPFEDEPHAFLVASRLPVRPAGSRILSPVQQSKPGVTLRLCTQAGVETRLVAKREGEAFKRAKKAGWGDSWT